MYYNCFICWTKIDLLKRRLYSGEEVLGYSEYMEYVAWEI